MKIGFILGTFDPPHIGHISMAVKCVDERIVDQVYFVPTMQNPWKDEPIASFKERVKLIELSIPKEFKSRIDVETIESKLFPPYYSCNTLLELSIIYPNDDLYIIGGADIINDLPKWKNYDDMIKGKYKVVGFTRSNVEIEDNDVKYVLVESLIPEISSTKVRELIKNRKCTYPFIPSHLSMLCKDIYTGYAKSFYSI